MIEDEVTALSNDVVHYTLHVPRVGASGHVPESGGRRVHRRQNVPARTNGEGNEYCKSQHDSVGVLAPPETSGARLVTGRDIA